MEVRAASADEAASPEKCQFYRRGLFPAGAMATWGNEPVQAEIDQALLAASRF
jgi:hypothetical protein